MIFISIILFCILSIINYTIGGKKITYPPFIFCFIWLAVMVSRIVFTQFYLEGLFPIEWDTYLLFAGGCMTVTVAGYLSKLQFVYFEKLDITGTRNREIEKKLVNSRLSIYTRVGLLLFCLLLFPLFLRYIQNEILTEQVENIFKSIRYETAVNEVSFGLYGYVVTLSCFVSLYNGYVFWHRKNMLNRILYIASIIVAIAFALATMRRSGVFMVISVNLAMYLISSPTVKIKQVVLSLVLFVLIFLTLGVVLEKGGSLNSSFKDNIDNSIETFAEYLITPMNAIDKVLHHPLLKQEGGKRTLRFFYVAGSVLGFTKIHPNDFDIVDSFLFVPYPVNVYTVYNPYIRDFGWMYALGWIFIFLFVHSNAYFKLRPASNNYFSKIIYSLLFFPLIMVFFNDQYISLLSTWIQLLLMTGSVYFIFWCKAKGIFFYLFPIKRFHSTTNANLL